MTVAVNVCIKRYYRYYVEVDETDWCPDGFIVEGGEVVDITGHIVYSRDDNGKEVIIWA